MFSSLTTISYLCQHFHNAVILFSLQLHKLIVGASGRWCSVQLQNALIQRTRHSLIYLLTLFPVPCQNNVTTASSDGVPAAKTSLSSSDHNDIDINHLLSPPPPSTPPPLQRFLSPVKRLQWSSSAVSWCLLSSRQSPWNFGVKILLAGAGWCRCPCPSSQQTITAKNVAGAGRGRGSTR